MACHPARIQALLNRLRSSAPSVSLIWHSPTLARSATRQHGSAFWISIEPHSFRLQSSSQVQLLSATISPIPSTPNSTVFVRLRESAALLLPPTLVAAPYLGGFAPHLPSATSITTAALTAKPPSTPWTFPRRHLKHRPLRQISLASPTQSAEPSQLCHPTTGFCSPPTSLIAKHFYRSHVSFTSTKPPSAGGSSDS